MGHLRSLNRILGYPDRERSLEKEKQPEPHPPVTGAERAEERIFEEAKKKAGIVSSYRTRLDIRK